MAPTPEKFQSEKIYWHRLRIKCRETNKHDIYLPRTEKTVKCFVTVATKRGVNERFIVALSGADAG